MILIVDHRSRFPKALLDSLWFRHVNKILSSHFVDQKFIVILSVFGVRMRVFTRLVFND